MLSACRLDGVGVVRPKRGNDCGVTAECFRAGRRGEFKDGPGQVLRHVLQHPDQPPAAPGAINEGVKLPVDSMLFFPTLRFGQLGVEALKAVQDGIGHVGDGSSRSDALSGTMGSVVILDVFSGDGDDEGPLVGLAFDEPFSFKGNQRFSNGESTDTERFRDSVLRYTSALVQIAGEDELPDVIGDFATQAGTVDLRSAMTAFRARATRPVRWGSFDHDLPRLLDCCVDFGSNIHACKLGR